MEVSQEREVLADRLVKRSQVADVAVLVGLNRVPAVADAGEPLVPAVTLGVEGTYPLLALATSAIPAASVARATIPLICRLIRSPEKSQFAACSQFCWKKR